MDLTPTHLYLTPAMSSRRLEAMAWSVSWYLSLKYTISTMPDWMTSLAHSLQGNRATKMVHPFTSEEFLFKIAFSSAWHTRMRCDEEVVITEKAEWVGNWSIM